jgi:uncharacterized damage-inducible protein DinB
MPSRNAELLGDQIHRLLDGDAWHGPNVATAVTHVTGADAAKRTAGIHTIHELVSHLEAWNRELLAVVRGRAYRTMSDSELWPSAATRDWSELCGSLLANGRELATTVATLSDAQLARRIEDRDYSLEQLLHGFCQHMAYHLGQIVQIKSLLAS